MQINGVASIRAPAQYGAERQNRPVHAVQDTIFDFSSPASKQASESYAKLPTGDVRLGPANDMVSGATARCDRTVVTMLSRADGRPTRRQVFSSLNVNFRLIFTQMSKRASTSVSVSACQQRVRGSKVCKACSDLGVMRHATGTTRHRGESRAPQAARCERLPVIHSWEYGVHQAPYVCSIMWRIFNTDPREAIDTATSCCSAGTWRMIACQDRPMSDYEPKVQRLFEYTRISPMALWCDCARKKKEENPRVNAPSDRNQAIRISVDVRQRI